MARQPLSLTVDGTPQTCEVDSRTTLLDLLREQLGNSSAKKGCDHGQCGACTVLVEGRRTLSCLTLALAQRDREVVTASGLADGERLHPVQEAFIAHDALQCGYCTPGQVCSAVGALSEHRAGHPSHATEDVAATPELDDAEIRERMSGNLCRCGAYAHIVAAVKEAASR